MRLAGTDELDDQIVERGLRHTLDSGDAQLAARSVGLELTQETMTMNWAAGWNMPGCIPEAEVDVEREWIFVRDYLADELAHCADNAAFAGEPDLVSDYDAARSELFATDHETEVTVHAGDYAYWIIGA
jgi:hypothetical protein